MRKFLCKIGWHKYEVEEYKSQTQNLGFELIFMVAFAMFAQRKCKYCGKVK